MQDSCCVPNSESRREPEPGSRPIPSAEKAGAALIGDLIEPIGSAFVMGTDGIYGYGQAGEGPAHEVVLSPLLDLAFCRHKRAIRNLCQGHRASHRTGDFGWSFFFSGLLPEDFPPTRHVAGSGWWRQVEGADWAHPEGPQSTIDQRADHPAIHISWNDAIAFCAWSRSRLPSEAEWELAARGGLAGRLFP